MAIASANRNEITEAVRSREPFAIASMSGGGVDPDRRPKTGKMPVEAMDLLCKDRATYIIWSYDTPIGWIGTRGAVVPAVAYSRTTSQHQSIARLALGL